MNLYFRNSFRIFIGQFVGLVSLLEQHVVHTIHSLKFAVCITSWLPYTQDNLDNNISS